MFDMAETLLVPAEPSQPDGFARISLTATAIRADPLAQCANSSRASRSGSARRRSCSSLPGQAGSRRPSSRPTTGACARCAHPRRARPAARPPRHRPRRDHRRVDSRSLQEFVGRWPWPRALQAMLVDYMQRGKPKVIALDVGFSEPEREVEVPVPGDGEITSAQSDQELADAVRRARQRHRCSPTPSMPGSTTARLDAEGVDRAAVSARPGDRRAPGHHAAVSRAGGRCRRLRRTTSSRSIRDGPARRFPPFIRQGDRYMPLARRGRGARRRRLSARRSRSRGRRDPHSRPARSRSCRSRSPTSRIRRRRTTSRRC